MATPAVHANAWFCLFLAVGMLLASGAATGRLHIEWLLTIGAILVWIFKIK